MYCVEFAYVCIYVCFMHVRLYYINSKFLAPFLLGAHRGYRSDFPKSEIVTPNV